MTIRRFIGEQRTDDMSDFRDLLNATDEEFDAFIGCRHDGRRYMEPGPLTGELHTRCAGCHSVVDPTLSESAQ